MLNTRNLIAAMLLVLPLTTWAQDDDGYFVSKKKAKRTQTEQRQMEPERYLPVEIVYADDDSESVGVSGSSRDVDEYNRRRTSGSGLTGQLVENPDGTLTYRVPASDTLYVMNDSTAITTDAFASELYNRGYEDGMADGEDYAYSRRISRFGYGGAYASPWYYSYYDPYYWDDWFYHPYHGYYGLYHWGYPYYRSYWGYRPYWYGGYWGWGGYRHHNYGRPGRGGYHPRGTSYGGRGGAVRGGRSGSSRGTIGNMGTSRGSRSGSVERGRSTGGAFSGSRSGATSSSRSSSSTYTPSTSSRSSSSSSRSGSISSGSRSGSFSGSGRPGGGGFSSGGSRGGGGFSGGGSHGGGRGGR